MQNKLAKMQGMNWNDLRYILAVGRTSSLAAAARKLSVNESTVGRRVSHVEVLLKTKLFERSVNGLIPTSAGLSAIRVAEDVEHQTQKLVGEISGSDQKISGNIRLTSVPILLNHVVVPAIPKLISDYPDIDVELIAENRNLSLSRRHADIAIRLSRPTKESRMVTRKIGTLDYAVYGSTNKRTPLPWINYEEDMMHLPQAQWMLKQIKISGHSSQIKVNDAESILSYLKNGVGQSLLPVFVGDNQANVVRISPEVVLSREIWMLVHPDIKELGHIRTAMDWLILLFGKYRN